MIKLKNMIQEYYGIARFRLTFFNIETNSLLKNDRKIKLYSKTENSIFTIKMYINRIGFLHPDRDDITFLMEEINKLKKEIDKLKNGDIVEAELISDSDDNN